MGNFTDAYNWTLYYNLPSKRTKISRIKKARDKILRKKDKEHTQIRKTIQNLGFEKLKVPIQKGYKRLFILTEDTKHLTNADFYQEILDKINTIRYSSIKNFEQKKAKKRRNRRHHKMQILQEPDSWYFYNVLKMDVYQQQFYSVPYKCSPTCNHQHLKFIFVEPWRFVLSVKPNFITEVKRIDNLLEQEYAELSDFLDLYSNQARLITMKGRSNAANKIFNKLEDMKRYRYNSVKNIPLYLLTDQFE